VPVSLLCRGASSMSSSISHVTSTSPSRGSLRHQLSSTGELDAGGEESLRLQAMCGLY
jgi:hypothetical protein